MSDDPREPALPSADDKLLAGIHYGTFATSSAAKERASDIRGSALRVIPLRVTVAIQPCDVFANKFVVVSLPQAVASRQEEPERGRILLGKVFGPTVTSD
jgi:hypothetical protein